MARIIENWEKLPITAVIFTLDEVLLRPVFKPDMFKNAHEHNACVADAIRYVGWDFLQKYGKKFLKKYKYLYGEVFTDNKEIIVAFFRERIERPAPPGGP